jgi:quinol monooxygenase YgiN
MGNNRTQTLREDSVPPASRKEKTGMIQASLEVVLTDSQQQQRFLSVLAPLLEPTSFEAGCIRCTIWRNVNDERRLRFVTEWQSSTDLDRYLKSGRFRTVLVAAELSVQAPNIAIQTISEPCGFEYIAGLLGCAAGAAAQGGDVDWQLPGGNHDG